MKFIKKLALLVTMVLIALTFTVTNNMPNVFAAGLSVSASSSTIAVGQSVNITVSTSGIIGKINVSGAVNDSFWSADVPSKTYTFTGTSVGQKITVSASTVDASDDAGALYSLSDSTTVTVVAPTAPEENPGNNTGNNGNTGGNNANNTPSNQPTNTPSETPTEKKSSDASLSELSISKGTLSPEFSADTTEYSVSLGKDETSLTINAKANSDLASVSGDGEQTLKAGMNEFSVICTAEDGSTRTYVIKASVDESPSVFIDYNDKKLGVVKDISMVSAPTNFEETKVMLGGSEITAWHNPLSKLTIVYLSDDANEKNFYLYDETTKSITSIYKPMGLLGRNIAVIDVPKELQEKEGMTFGEVEVSGVKMMGWKFNDAKFENFTLIYVMDEQGKMVYYLHEKSEDTLQLYTGQAALTQEMADDQADALKQRMIMIIALLITNIITIILLLVKVLKKPKGRTPIRTRMNEETTPFIKEEDLPLGHSVFKSINEDEENIEETKDQSEEDI